MVLPRRRQPQLDRRDHDGPAPYNQSAAIITGLQGGNWCNPPGAGNGLKPTASTGVALADAYLWVKNPGESDGQCNIAGGARSR